MSCSVFDSTVLHNPSEHGVSLYLSHLLSKSRALGLRPILRLLLTEIVTACARYDD
jgi:hypothetical protein